MASSQCSRATTLPRALASVSPPAKGTVTWNGANGSFLLLNTVELLPGPHRSVSQARPVAALASDDRMEFSEAFKRKGSCVSLPNPGMAGKAKTEVPWTLGLCALPHYYSLQEASPGREEAGGRWGAERPSNLRKVTQQSSSTLGQAPSLQMSSLMPCPLDHEAFNEATSAGAVGWPTARGR